MRPLRDFRKRKRNIMSVVFNKDIDKNDYENLKREGLVTLEVPSMTYAVMKGRWEGGPAYVLWKGDAEGGRLIQVAPDDARKVEEHVAAGNFSDFE